MSEVFLVRSIAHCFLIALGVTDLMHIIVICCNRWVRFDSLDVRLYIGPHVDLRVLQGFIITGGEIVVLKASLTF